ncbi:MAG: symmetrical bis(5'-nucleosyl)-tetraphosphatase [Betaproteobacteria bacterium]|nr:symmetrical bis(5'-nucleosyl)-tetraphosphatase [Betaproteobacteria bacterium]
MATYAIGDVQGCYDELRLLLAKIAYEPARDRLWFVGDLVNRGPKSLEVLRFVRSLGDCAITVLGNHDLHLIAFAEGFWKKRADDTLDAVIAAPDGRQLVEWLRARALIYVEGGYTLVHAGLLPGWSIERARTLAREVEHALAAPGYREFLAHMYGSRPDRWDDSLAGWDRLRAIVNVMTRMRFCTRNDEIEVRSKGAKPPKGFRPWFDLRPAGEESTLICGHWSALGLKVAEHALLIDTGCVWGGTLTAVRLEDREIIQVPCAGYQAPGEDS